MNENAVKIMPALFLGHGSPMNAVEKNSFTAGFEKIVRDIPLPKAVLCISAHWETRGTYVTAMDRPETIHDFGGFPLSLYRFQYPAPGDGLLAERIRKMIHSAEVKLNYDWGLDHGCWVVMKYLYPKADIPVVELSIDGTKPAAWHYALAKELAALRTQGVLVIGSGNIVHNLRRIDWDHVEDEGFGYDWAEEFNEKIKELVFRGDHDQIVNIGKTDNNYLHAVPTPEHFLPLVYILALQREEDGLTFFNDALVGGSLSMTSLMLEP